MLVMLTVKRSWPRTETSTVVG